MILGHFKTSLAACGASLAPLTLTALLAVAPAPPAAAHSYKVGPISIGHMWARPTEAGQVLSVFGPIFNTGGEADRLESVTSPEAGRAGICTVNDKGEPDWSTPVVLNPGKVIALAAWREQICLQGLKQAAKADQMIDVELEFEHAGTVDIEVLIESKGSGD